MKKGRTQGRKEPGEDNAVSRVDVRGEENFLRAKINGGIHTPQSVPNEWVTALPLLKLVPRLRAIVRNKSSAQRRAERVASYRRGRGGAAAGAADAAGAAAGNEGDAAGGGAAGGEVRDDEGSDGVEDDMPAPPPDSCDGDD